MARHRSSALYGAGIMWAYFLLIFNSHISFQSCNRRSTIDIRRHSPTTFFEIAVYYEQTIFFPFFFGSIYLRIQELLSRSMQLPYLAYVAAFYRLIYFYYSFSSLKEKQFQSCDMIGHGTPTEVSF